MARFDERIYLCLKRAVDLVAAVLVIFFILSWLLPLLGLLILLDGPGPVFFVQRRVGKGGSIFSCYKLRTMVVNTSADSLPARDQDSRVTRVGYWLRRSHLDELPQFFNVLSGVMSLVGPRPYMLADVRVFRALCPGYQARERVKPGITGLSQVKGLHGGPADVAAIRDRMRWDLYYIRHRGVALDLRILAGTMLMLARQGRIKTQGPTARPEGTKTLKHSL